MPITSVLYQIQLHNCFKRSRHENTNHKTYIFIKIQVQYIRFISTTSATSSASGSTTTTNATIKTFQPQTSSHSSNSGSKPVPVAGMTINRSTSAKTLIPSSTHHQTTLKSSASTSGQTTRLVIPRSSATSTTQRVLIPNTAANKSITTIPASALSQLQGATIIPSTNTVGQIVMLPANYVQQLQAQAHAQGPTMSSTMGAKKVAIPAISKLITTTHNKPAKLSIKQHIEYVSAAAALPSMRQTNKANSDADALSRNLEQNGIRPRKPCNCTKSQCLKLYCDCFANGEFCHMCNCLNCNNNLENEEHRQKAIKSCLERNPNAFRPKIGKGRDWSGSGDVGVRKHTKGCNCKRSGCLKNYCECYEAKIACSSNCKCMGCRNIEDSMDKKRMRTQIEAELVLESTRLRDACFMKQDIANLRPKCSAGSKLASSFISEDVVEATNACLLACACNEEYCTSGEDVLKEVILKEFGRCFLQIIEASKTK